jgi:hypothetical protein
LQTTWYKYEVLLQMYWATLESLLGTWWEHIGNKEQTKKISSCDFYVIFIFFHMNFDWNPSNYKVIALFKTFPMISHKLI